MNIVVAIQISDIQEHEFNITIHYHICEKPFNDIDKKVRDHCHLSGRFRGAGHNNCNLNYKNSLFTVPIVFYNLSNGHYLVRSLSKDGTVKLLSINKEKFGEIYVKNLTM